MSPRGPRIGGALARSKSRKAFARYGYASAAGLGGLSSFFSLGTWAIAIAGALALVALYSAVMSRNGSHSGRSVST